MAGFGSGRPWTRVTVAMAAVALILLLRLVWDARDFGSSGATARPDKTAEGGPEAVAPAVVAVSLPASQVALAPPHPGAPAATPSPVPSITSSVTSLRDVGYARVEAASLDLSHLSRKSARAGDRVPRELMSALGLGPDDQLVVLRHTEDKRGNRHTRYQQTYRGIAIFGEHIIVHSNSAGQEVRASGLVVQGLDESALGLRKKPTSSPTAPSISGTDNELSAQEAIAAAKASRGHDTPKFTILREAVQRVVYIADGEAARVVYYINYFVEGDGPTRPFFLIDAVTGEIFDQWEGLAHGDALGPGGNVKVGRYVYGTDYPPLDITQSGDNCLMETAQVVTIDLNQGFFGVTPFKFLCPENLHEETNGGFSPLNDAHFFGSLAFQMYDEWVGVPPLTSTLFNRVHYGVDFENAFWDGFSVNFGDGGERFHPLTDVNVTIHEVSHGFTEQNSNLIYSNQSGGMNESFSDIAGEAGELYWQGSVDWLQGAAITKRVAALRYFADPTRDGLSIAHASDYQPGLDVHFSSGVYNRSYFLLATTPTWTALTAFELFAHANLNYWSPSETFDTGACGLLGSAVDLGILYPSDIVAALEAVGVACALPLMIDADADGIDDAWERFYGLDEFDPTDAEQDGDDDGLANLEEFQSHSSPISEDTDRDGLTDFDEVRVYETTPSLSDTDGDGLVDGDEVHVHETDPGVPDSDADSLADGDEIELGTDPLDPDTDADGQHDGFEVAAGLDPLYPGDALDDADGDGLSNVAEFENGADPTNPDTDGDTVSDGDEVLLHGTDPLRIDTDRDGMDDGWEIRFGLGPLVDDSEDDFDGDGAMNLFEFDEGTDPADALSQPPTLDAFSLSPAGVLYQVNVRTGVATEVGGVAVADSLEGLAFNDAGELFAVDGRDSLLYRIDPLTGAAALVGSLGLLAGQLGLAFDDDGTLWMASRTRRSLYRIDTDTGEATPVAIFSESLSGLADGLAWDGDNLYGLSVFGELYTIDRSTAEVIPVGNLGVGFPVDFGFTADQLGRLWALAGDGSVYLVDKATGAGTRTSTTAPLEFESLALYTFRDTDRDGAADVWELAHGLDPLDPSDGSQDRDGDGLSERGEFVARSSPFNPDTDFDDLTDGDEVHIHGTSPTRIDSDRDGLPDGYEVLLSGTDPLVPETDPDGLGDGADLSSQAVDIPALGVWPLGVVGVGLLLTARRRLATGGQR